MKKRTEILLLAALTLLLAASVVYVITVGSASLCFTSGSGNPVGAWWTTASFGAFACRAF